ncbi:MAG TPA: hypothetical protein VF541_19035 [Longimicrobium sp.]|jgi:hypothetical protein
MKRIAVAMLLSAAACRSLPRNDGARGAAEPLRLCVQNATVAYGNVVAHAGTVRFDVMSGEEICKRVTVPTASMVLRASTTAGGANGPLSFTTSWQPGATPCWTWRLTDAPGSPGELLPCDFDPAGGRGSDSVRSP